MSERREASQQRTLYIDWNLSHLGVSIHYAFNDL